MSNETNTTDDFLDYDINESFSHFDWVELGPVVVVYSLTFFLGLIGNVVIIGSTLCPRLRPLPATPTNVFLGGLATADLLLILFCIPVKVAKLFSYTWTMGLFLCKSVHYMQSVSAICSVVTLTAMSIERYYAIVHPMRAQYTCTISQARKIVIITWVASFLLGIPMIFTQTHKEVGVRVIAYWCVRDSEAGLFWRAHEVYMLVLVLILPLTVMAFCYTAICWEIWRVMKRRYHMTSRRALNPTIVDTESIPMTQRQVARNSRRTHREDEQTEEESRTMRQVVKMLVAVVVLFAICWGPILVYNTLTAYGFLPQVKIGTYKHLNTAFQLMAYFNSCINPIIYGFMSKHFRESFLSAACGGWWICCPRRGYRAPVKRHPSLSQTRTTSVSWDKELESEEYSATMGGRLLEKYVAQRYLMKTGRGPGTHEISQWPENILQKACKTIKRDVGFGTVPLFQPSWASTTPGPGYTRKNPYHYVDQKRRRGSSCVPTFEYDGLQPRFRSIAKSWVLPCNLYDPKDPKSLEAFLQKVTGKRGPYDLFTGPRDASTIRSYQTSAKLEDHGDWPRSLPSELNRLLHKSNYFKGRWTTCPRFPKVSGMRIMLKDLALCYKDPKQPGPGHYDPKSPRKPRNTKNYPFNMNIEFVRPGPSMKFQPAPGRYNIKDTKTIEGHGWTFVFKSKAPRTNFIIIPTYNAF